MAILEIETQVLVNLLYAHIAACAFIATLYTLFSKDSKLKPGSTGLLKVLLVLCIGAVLMIFAIIFKVAGSYFDYLFFGTFIFSIGTFSIGWIGLFSVYYKAHNRIFHLREDVKLNYTQPLKWIRKYQKQDYELESKKRVIDNQLNFLNKQLTENQKQEIADGYSFFFTGDDEVRITNTIMDLLFNGIENGETVNYVCVDKHPIEVWNRIKKNHRFSACEEKIKENFIMIDAYTTNFGFDDEINIDKLGELKAEGVEVVSAKTIPGIHSGTAVAFNITKEKEKQKGRNIRRQNRMIYDSLSALAPFFDLEAIETFYCHMIPAEKNYGMWTFIIESSNGYKEIDQLCRRLVDSVLQFSVGKSNEPAVIEKLRTYSEESVASQEKGESKK